MCGGYFRERREEKRMDYEFVYCCRDEDYKSEEGDVECHATLQDIFANEIKFHDISKSRANNFPSIT